MIFGVVVGGPMAKNLHVNWLVFLIWFLLSQQLSCSHSPEYLLQRERIGNTTYHIGLQTNSGQEIYDSWFADTDGRIIYFGQSPFWREYFAAEVPDPQGDLRKEGDYLIGRFDTEKDTFLAPLKVGRGRASVVDVLYHTKNHNVYFTTFFDMMGYVNPKTNKVVYFKALGMGFNELYEGPGGKIYVTRYSSEQKNGSVVVITPAGTLLKEFFIRLPGFIIAPKSIAVSPITGEIIINTDMFSLEGGMVRHDSFVLGPEGQIKQRIMEREIFFMSFDPQGKNWAAGRAKDGSWQMSITYPEGKMVNVIIDEKPVSFNVIQDIKHHGRYTIATAWSGNLYYFKEDYQGITFIPLEPDTAVGLDAPPKGKGILAYTTIIANNGFFYGTISHGILIFKLPPP
jgi:hypothetical protein